MRVETRRVIEAPIEQVWKLVADPTRYAHFLPEALRFEPTGWPSAGMGARYTYHLRVGGAAIAGVMEVVERRQGYAFAMASVSGLELRCSWLLRPAEEDGRTEVVLRLYFRAPGGLLGVLADHVGSRIVRARARQALERLAAHLAGQDAHRRPYPPLERIALQVHGLLTLVRSGVVRPLRPDALMKVLAGFLRWDLTVAFGYALGAAAHPERPAIVDDRGTLTFAEVNERTGRLAGGLAQLGVGAGCTVAVLCRNHRGLPETLAACAKLGAHTVLLNAAGSALQVAAVVRAHQARVVVADAEFRPLLRRLPRGVHRVTAAADAPTRATTLERLIASAPAAPALPVRPPRSRVVVLTSGTTGTPKGARRPQPSGLGPAAAVLSRIPLRAGEPILVPAPLFHTWGLAAFQLSLALSSTLVLTRRFDPADTLCALERHRCTAMFAVPVMLQRIMELPAAERARYDLSALRVVACSGSALPGPLATRFQGEFGPLLYNLYGSTECSWVSIATPTDLRAAPGTAGRPPRGTRLAILDQEGNPVPDGQVGQIFVANDMLFDGYTNGTARPLLGGLMSTGDVGYLDSSGLLFVVGRDDDMVISGGENVYPHEVEELLAALPEVREVAVKGVPDEDLGQRLAAFVVLSNGVQLEASKVKAHVRANLAKFSVPRDVVFVEGLPRNAAGKVLKYQLRLH